MSENTNPIPQCLQPAVIARFSLKSKSNFGELCRQTFRIISKPDDIENQVLAITKIIYTDRTELYEQYGFIKLKEFKGKILYKQVFSIKVNSLQDAFRFFQNEL